MARRTAHRFTIHRLTIHADIQQETPAVTRHRRGMVPTAVAMVEAIAILRVEAEEENVQSRHRRRRYLHRAVDLVLVESDHLNQAARGRQDASRR